MSRAFDQNQMIMERALLAALGEAVIATDLDGAIIFWNRAAESVYGWSADEVLGRGILDVTPTAMSRDEAAAIFARLLKGETWSGRFETRRKDGSELVADVTDYPVRDDLGRLVAIVGISRPAQALGDKAADRQGRRSRSGAFLWRGPSLRDVSVSLAIYAGAVLLRFGLDQLIPGQLPFVTFLPAVALGAVLVGPFFSAVLLAAFVATGLAWLEHHGSSSPAAPLSATGLFIVAGAVLVLVLGYAGRARRTAQEKEEQLALLNNELRHRIKNLFALTTSICLQTIRTSPSLDAAASAIVGRIQAIAAAQDLSAEGDQSVELDRLAREVLQPIAPGADRLAMRGPRVMLPTADASSLSLLLHELATNATKYGAWSGRSGCIDLSWKESGRSLEIEWTEHGADLSTTAVTRRGFGTKLLARAFPRGVVKHEIRPQGAHCEVRLPR